jgi:hypothetical protein
MSRVDQHLVQNCAGLLRSIWTPGFTSAPAVTQASLLGTACAILGEHMTVVVPGLVEVAFDEWRCAYPSIYSASTSQRYDRTSNQCGIRMISMP